MGDGAEVSKRPTAVVRMVACLVEGEQSTFGVPWVAEGKFGKQSYIPVEQVPGKSVG